MTTVFKGLPSGGATTGRQAGALAQKLSRDGGFPKVSLLVKPLSGGPPVVLDHFLSYQFSSSILVPVDSFSFDFTAPDSREPLNRVIREGDIMQLSANNQVLATGVVMQPSTEVDAEFAETGTLNGMDLLSYFELQDSVSLDSRPIWGNQESVRSAVAKLIANTRLQGLRVQDAPGGTRLFATEAGESKLTALQRFLEPLNCVFWMDPDGKLVVGRPNMAQASLGTLICNREKRMSNVLSMRAVRSAAGIPNIYVPIWSGQENTTDRVGPQQLLYNAAPGPDRLRKLGHRIIRTVVVSAPDASTTAGKDDLARFQSAGSSNLLQAYAKRQAARDNINELIVEAVVAGHYNENGLPYQVDQVYRIDFDRGDVDENMYLFGVDYRCAEPKDQLTSLYFCRLGSIVADTRAP